MIITTSTGTFQSVAGSSMHKYRRKIALSIVFLILSNGSSLAQSLTIKENKASFLSVIEKIKKQTGLDYLGDLELLKQAKPVTLNVKNATIEQVLNELCKQQNFDLISSDKTIIIRPKNSRREEQFPTRGQQRQRKSLVGNVFDEDGNPLDGATVRLKGANTPASITSQDGSYSLEVFHDSEVIYSMVGYEAHTESLQGRVHFNVKLVRIQNQIEETVITGYGAKKKESFTGASTTITRKQLEKFNNRNIFAVIQSLDPAFKITENQSQGSNPNQLPDITVRGQNMVSGESNDVRGQYALNSPLIIMDGFQVDLQRLFDLDVNRIETITLLKDASATSLYGSRGANGVLVIETRLPKEGKFTISYSLQPSISVVDLSDFNLMNAAEKLEYEKLAGIYDSDSPIQRDRLQAHYASRYLDVQSGVNTDWSYQPIQTPTSLAHSLRIEGGNQQVRYSIDGSYGETKGAMKGSNRVRSGAGFTLFYRMADKVTFRNIANFIGTKFKESPYGSLSSYSSMNPYFRIHDDNGNLIRVYNEDFAKEMDNRSYLNYNPLYDASLPFKNDGSSTNISNNLSVEINLIPELRVRASGMISKSFNKSENFLSPKNSIFYTKELLEEKGQYTFQSGDGFEFSGNLNLNFGKSFNKHAINLMANAEVRGTESTSTGYIVTGFIDDDIIQPNMANRYLPNNLPMYSNPVSRMMGFLFNGTYIYDERFVFEGNYRVDGSSAFGKEKRFNPFWSTGLAYNLHKESFLENSPVNLLRVFGNFGVSGSDMFSPGMTATSYTGNMGSLYYLSPSLLYNSEGNPFLMWPKVYSLSLGLEGGFFNDLINIRFNKYDKKTIDMVSRISTAPSVGLKDNSYYQNIGEVTNKGYEVYINWRAYQNTNNGLNWYINASGITNKNKLTKISEALKLLNANNVGSGGIVRQTPYYEEGESLNNIKGLRSLGIDPASGREVYLTRDGQVTYDWSAEHIQVLADATPKLEGSIGTILSYKGFSLQAQFLYMLGKYTYNQTLVDKVENNNPAYNADKRVLSERWRQPGDEAMFKAINDQRRTQLSSRFIQKENMLKLSSLNFNYEFNTEFISKLRLQRARLNFSMNDLFHASTIRMERGTDYPFARTFNFGISVDY